MVHVLNPTHVHRYAISFGNRGKTDLLDAEVIAQYIAQRHTTQHPYEPISPKLQQVRVLQAQVNGGACEHVVKAVSVTSWLRERPSEEGPGRPEFLERAA